MGDCIFCKIGRGEIPSTKVYEDERVLAFRDINPQAPVHILIIPKEHMADVLECANHGKDLLQHMMCMAAKIAAEQNLTDGGFRLVTNCGENAGQSVAHFHIHLLGGAPLSIIMA